MAILDTISEWFTSPVESFQKQVDELRAKVKEFIATYDRLYAKADIAATDEALNADYADLMWQANIVKQVVEGVTQGIDWATGYFNQIFGGNSLEGLGLAPVAGAAAIVAAIAAITSWLSYAYTVERKIQAREKELAIIETMQAQGASADEIATALGSQSATKNIKQLAIVVLIGAALYSAWPTINGLLTTAANKKA